jgi:hypothetical protein
MLPKFLTRASFCVCCTKALHTPKKDSIQLMDSKKKSEKPHIRIKSYLCNRPWRPMGYEMLRIPMVLISVRG